MDEILPGTHHCRLGVT